MTIRFLLRAYATACASAATYASPPRDRLITCAPRPTALTIPLATSSTKPSQLESKTLMGRMDAVRDIPAIPPPLFVLAAITPATCVPWPHPSDVPAPPDRTL